MEKRTVFIFFFIMAVASQGLSQSDTIIRDNSRACWAVRIINFQQEIKKNGNPFNAVITPQTVLEVKQNASGELYVKVTINSDRIQVLSGLVNKMNLKDYDFREKTIMKSQPDRPAELSTSGYDISDYRVNKNIWGIVAEEEPEDARLVEYQVIEKKTGKQLPSLTVEYVFPVPEPIFMSVDSQLIENAESRIGDDIWYDTSVIRYAGLQLNKLSLGKPLKATQPLAEGLVLPAGRNSVFISFKRIRYYGEANISLEYKLILVAKPLFEYETLLQDYGFARTHQSHLVNKRYVRSLVKEDGGYLLLDNGAQIPVARQKKEFIKKWLG